MKTTLSMTVLALAVGLCAGSAASAPQPLGVNSPNYDNGHALVLANTIVKAKGGAKLSVSSPSFKNRGDLDWKYTGFRENTFPGLNWSKGPKGTQSYVVALQGVELPPGTKSVGSEDEALGTSIHMLVYNVPAEINKLDVGMTAFPAGASPGSTVHGFKDVYAGPHSHSVIRHDYHFQVFAVDRVIPVNPKMTLAALQKEMAGHVLAAGETIVWAGLDPESDWGKEAAAKAAAAKK